MIGGIPVSTFLAVGLITEYIYTAQLRASILALLDKAA
jgi:hypothetical protein